MNHTNNHHRRSIRLKGFDYASPGAYFITLITYRHACLFGEIRDGEMELSTLGLIVKEEWMRSIEIRKEIRLEEDEFVIMPNHIHGIVWLVERNNVADGICPDIEGVKNVLPDFKGARRAPQQSAFHRSPRSLGSFIAGYKASVTSRARKELNIEGIWQRNYYEHILRNEKEHERIYAYIESNPVHWAKDEENIKK